MRKPRPEFANVTEFAHIAKLSRVRISQLKKAGKLIIDVNQPKKQINVRESLAFLKSSTARLVTKSGRAGVPDQIAADLSRKTRDALLSKIESEEKKAHYEANLKELEFNTKSGELVEKSEVESQAFEMARIVRDMVLNIPVICAPKLASVLGLKKERSHEIETNLTEYCKDILSKVSMGL